MRPAQPNASAIQTARAATTPNPTERPVLGVGMWKAAPRIIPKVAPMNQSKMPKLEPLSLASFLLLRVSLR